MTIKVATAVTTRTTARPEKKKKNNLAVNDGELLKVLFASKA